MKAGARLTLFNGDGAGVRSGHPACRERRGVRAHRGRARRAARVAARGHARAGRVPQRAHGLYRAESGRAGGRAHRAGDDIARRWCASTPRAPGRRPTTGRRSRSSACEQCGRNRVPPVAPVMRLTDWLARDRGAAPGLLLRSRGGLRAARIAAAVGRRDPARRAGGRIYRRGTAGRLARGIRGGAVGAARTAHGDRGARGARGDADAVGRFLTAPPFLVGGTRITLNSQ